MKVLLSIKPEFANRIFDGSKRFEFRRSIFRDRSVRTVVVYATKPIGKIIGEFDVADIIEAKPARLWELTWPHAGISQERFDDYFEGRESGFAIAVADVRQFSRPIEPNDAIVNFTPPQSYMYVRDDLARVLGGECQYELL